jgi:hypothetical protein
MNVLRVVTLACIACVSGWAQFTSLPNTGGGGGAPTAGTAITVAGQQVSLDVASQAEAEAGVSATKGMTPQRTAQAIAALAAGASVSGDGMVSNSGGTLTGRTITSTCLIVTNGDGVAGAPTIEPDYTCLAGLAENNPFSGVNDFTSGALILPNSTTVPSTCTAGSLYFDTDGTSGERLKVCNATDSYITAGSSSTPTAPVDPTSDTFMNYLTWKDDFMCANSSSTSATAFYGDLSKWRLLNNTGTGAVSCEPADSTMAGIVRLSTTTTSASDSTLYMGFPTSSQGSIPNLGSSGPFVASGSDPAWKAVFYFRTDDTAVTDYDTFVGFQSISGSFPTSNLIGMFLDSGGTPAGLCDSGSVATGNFGFANNAAGTGACVDSGVAAVANTNYKVEIWSDVLGTVKFSLNGGGTSSVTGAPTTQMMPVFSVGNSTAGTTLKILDIDYFAFIGRGLVR